MNDGTPSPEQRRRIEERVLDRIDARRRLARGIAGGTVAVVLLAGTVGLVATAARSGGTASGSAASSGGATAATSSVSCAVSSGSDSSQALRVRVPTADLPDAALRACGTSVDFQSGTGRMPLHQDGPSAAASGRSAPTPSGSPAAGVLCIDVDGDLVVLARTGAAGQTCVRAGMRVWQR